MKASLRTAKPLSLPPFWVLAPSDPLDPSQHMLGLGVDDSTNPAVYCIIQVQVTDDPPIQEHEFVRAALDFALSALHASLLKPEDRRPEFDPPGPSS